MGKPGVFKRISGQDKTITPFKVYKSWRYESTSSLDADNIDRLEAIQPNPLKYTGNRVTLDTWQTENDSGSILINTANDKEASLIWYSLDHLYYKRAGKPAETFGYADPQAIERTIFPNASVISIPQKNFGESIKPGSVKLVLKNSAINSTTMSFVDDGKGNLIDTELSGSIPGEILYLGFNSMTYAKNWTDVIDISSLDTTQDINTVYVDTNLWDLNVVSKNVWITPKYNLPSGSGILGGWGNAAHFYEDSYIRIPNRDEVNFKQSQDYAVAFWYYREEAQPGETVLLSKRTTGTGDILSNGILNTGDVNYNASQYPFEIKFKTISSPLYFSISTGTEIATITESFEVGDRKHIILQKTGSNLQVYIDGVMSGETKIPNGNIHNDADIFIGSLGLVNGSANKGIKGAIDEFFIFNKALTLQEVTQLSYNDSLNLMTTNTNAVGNVFYEHGMIVLSDPRPKYGTADYRMFNDKLYNYKTGQLETPYIEDFYLEFNSTVTLYEHEFVCKIKEDEFNFTSNDTIRLDNNGSSEVPKDFVANDKFAPYITTVGLYTDKGELVAVGKLGTPIRKRDDVDLNIIVRFDV
jgi:hypothetical protein